MNHEELEACIESYGKDIYSFCRKLTGSRQEADDLYQDTFLKMTELRERIKVDHNPKSYLLSVALNLWRNRRRKSAWRQRIAGTEISQEDDAVSEIPSDEASVEEQMLLKEERMLVQQAVQRLPEKYRLPILLFYMEELKLTEIAEILHLSEGTVKSRLHKARKVLEKELEVVLNEEKHR